MGCGWRKGDSVQWCDKDKKWIFIVDSLFTDIVSSDYLSYLYTSTGSRVSNECLAVFKYNHEEWERVYAQKLTEVKVEELSSACDTQWPLTPKVSRKLKRKRRCRIKVTSTPATQSNEADSFSTPLKRNQSDDDLTTESPSISISPIKRRRTLNYSDDRSFSASDNNDGPEIAMAWNPNATRGQLASLSIPPVQEVHPEWSIEVATAKNSSVSDPSKLSVRPPETFVDDASTLLRKSSDSGFVSSSLGCFDEDGLDKLKAIQRAARIKQQVADESAWLLEKDDDISAQDSTFIRLKLLHSRPTETILKTTGKLSIDAQSLSCLARERYLDNFLIDVCLQQFLKELNASKHCICLPTHALTWIKQGRIFFNKKVQPFIAEADPTKLSLALLPVNLNNAHWGLAVIDFNNGQLYFDEGLGWNAPNDLVKDLQPIACTLSGHWKPSSTSQLRRFGIPNQPRHGGTGSGTCGVAVILAARDIMKAGSLGKVHFTWEFADMSYHRKHIALKVLQWAST